MLCRNKIQIIFLKNSNIFYVPQKSFFGTMHREYRKKELLYLCVSFILAEIRNKTNKKSKYMKFPKIVNENRNFLHISKVCFLYNKEGLKSTERQRVS